MAPYLDMYRGLHSDADNDTCVKISRCTYERSFIYPLSTVTIEDTEFPAPAQPHLVLKQDYGPFYLLTPTEAERESSDLEQASAVCDSPVTHPFSYMRYLYTIIAPAIIAHVCI
jgi:hypothetical protein